MTLRTTITVDFTYEQIARSPHFWHGAMEMLRADPAVGFTVTHSNLTMTTEIALTFDVDHAPGHRYAARLRALSHLVDPVEDLGYGGEPCGDLDQPDDEPAFVSIPGLDACAHDYRPDSCWRCDARAGRAPLGLCPPCHDHLAQPDDH